MEAIRLDPKNPFWFYDRGTSRSAGKEYGKAIEDFDEAVRLDPKFTLVFLSRANARYANKEYDKALADYDEVIRLEPKCDLAFNGRAWLLATCPDEKHRDGKKALDSARQACELTDRKNAGFIDTLAAACAEVGDFESAVKYQQYALDSPTYAEQFREEGRRRLQLYKDHKPYRQE